MHLHLPAVLLTVVYAAAGAVALVHPDVHPAAALVVLTALVARWAVRHRRAHSAVPAGAVADPVSAAAPSPATAA